MQDYTGNSKREKEAAIEKPKKNVERVTTGNVIVKKKSVGTKFKDVFVAADLRSVAAYVLIDVLIPAAKNMVYDAGHEGLRRMMFGERAVRSQRYGGPTRTTYNNINNPLNRSYRDVTSRSAPTVNPGSRLQRAVREDFIIATREEAEQVLERMNDIIDQYEVISVADFNELVGYQSTHVDNKWGWTYLGDVQIRQIREGYLIDLPPAEPIG